MAWFTKHKIQLPKDLPTGFILGKCELVDIIDGNEGQRFGSGSLVQKVWVVENPRRPARPIKMKGQLGLVQASPTLVRKFEGERSHK